MRQLFAGCALVAATLLGACVFESQSPLVPPGDYATPLTPGAYEMQERKDDGSFEKQEDVTLNVANNVYTLMASDGPMRFVLYRISPNIFLAQVTDEPDENVYALVEPDAAGAAITHLPCKSLNVEERTRFHLSADTQSSCVFSTLDDVVTAALYLKGRGEAPSLKLVRRQDAR